MKKFVVTLFIFFSVLINANVSNVSQNADKIILENSIMRFVDGIGVKGEIFGFILQCRRKGRNRLYGVATSTGKRVGMFEYQGKKYCLVELAKIEKEYEAEYLSKLGYLEKNKPKYSADEWKKERRAIENEYRTRKDSLKDVFEYAQKDFIDITVAYLDSAAGMKDLLMIIIKEFCDKKGLKDCFLLDWGKTKEGEELDSIKKNIGNFSDLTRLWVDMTDFLETMARSCPKAKAMFIEMVRRAKEEASK